MKIKNNILKIIYKNQVEKEIVELNKLLNIIYTFLIEVDLFKNDSYHLIFKYIYLYKNTYNQKRIGIEIGMDQTTVSRKNKEIEIYIIKKIKENPYLKKYYTI